MQVDALKCSDCSLDIGVSPWMQVFDLRRQVYVLGNGAIAPVFAELSWCYDCDTCRCVECIPTQNEVTCHLEHFHREKSEGADSRDYDCHIFAAQVIASEDAWRKLSRERMAGHRRCLHCGSKNIEPGGILEWRKPGPIKGFAHPGCGGSLRVERREVDIRFNRRTPSSDFLPRTYRAPDGAVLLEEEMDEGTGVVPSFNGVMASIQTKESKSRGAERAVSAVAESASNAVQALLRSVERPKKQALLEIRSGLLGGDKVLTVDEDAVHYGAESMPLDEIEWINWYDDTALNPGQSRIDIGSAAMVFAVASKDKALIERVNQALAPVAERLVRKIGEDLSSGKWLHFGAATVGNKGVWLPKYGLLGKSEAFVEWPNVSAAFSKVGRELVLHEEGRLTVQVKLPHDVKNVGIFLKAFTKARSNWKGTMAASLLT